MRIAASGFVGENSGSVATANVLLLKRLLSLGHCIEFFSKPSFVDPRSLLKDCGNFKFHAVDNVFSDRLRQRLAKVPAVSLVAGQWDCWNYNKLLISRIAEEHKINRYDLCVWFGTYSPGRIQDLPMVSFAQGPPGSDANSIIDQFAEIQSIAGRVPALRWLMLAWLRLSKLGLPNFRFSDHIIVGCDASRNVLEKRFGVPSNLTSSLPYPVDLERFCLGSKMKRLTGGTPLRVLWLGRIIPRKRLDVFLHGMEIAIAKGLLAECTIVGDVGFIPGYERLIESFAFPERVRWIRNIPHRLVAETLNSHDVLAQPSDNENFGSSVAEAQACGLPVIVGRSNGNREYLCERDIALEDDQPESFANALLKVHQMIKEADESAAALSRSFAVKHFAVEQVVDKLLQVFRITCDECEKRKVLS